MHRETIRGALCAVCAVAMMLTALAASAAAADCPAPPPCDADPNCPISTYAHEVIYGEPRLLRCTTGASARIATTWATGCSASAARSTSAPWNWEEGIPGDRGRLVLGASGRWWSQADPDSRMCLEWHGGLDDAALYRSRIPTAEDVDRLWRIGTSGA